MEKEEKVQVQEGQEKKPAGQKKKMKTRTKVIAGVALAAGLPSMAVLAHQRQGKGLRKRSLAHPLFPGKNIGVGNIACGGGCNKMLFNQVLPDDIFKGKHEFVLPLVLAAT